MDLGLSGKCAVVTGASRGIGLAVAEVLAAEGADLALVARDAEALAAVAERLGKHGTKVVAVPTDTTDDTAVAAMAERVRAEFGAADVLVNCAAPASTGVRTPLAELRDEDLRTEIETKVLGYLRCARALAPGMRERGWGRIVNVSGLNARLAGSTFGSIRNVAVAAMTKNLADELGPHGITVTVVHPGYTVTEQTPEKFAAIAAKRGISVAELENGLAAGVSNGRLVTAAEVADVVAFLASPRSVAINGDAIAAGGGVPGSIYY
ncbi:SDR family NAD(P)-dependent oxidoreductase [Amycolatopsis benzoatilytica]|uniref:SDR family NAD(P)-dependent oxidoreductase n=1 Tax=Amycolatopsis benzoatilytica TaxID=346045 RepID=UPI00036D6277|nr:SDR family NAD(P)-dependent oxidoreductase [Amycolatopsis benzoatilytica]